MSKTYPNLFSPMAVGPVTLKNRIVQSALTSNSSRGGEVTDRMLNIYRTRARGGAAMIVTEALAGHSQQQIGRRVRAMDEQTFEGLKRWADVVVSNDCLLLGQLMDSGRGRHQSGRSLSAVGPSPLPDDLSWSIPHELTVPEITRMIEEFGQTAHRLQRAGFSGVELSCGHGHLFHQFLSAQANRREDDYGGSLENRTRLIRELCDSIRSSCGNDFVLGIKLVGDDGVPGGVDPRQSIEIAGLIARHQPHYFAIAQGAHHRSLELHVPDRTYAPTPYRGITRQHMQAAPGVPILAVGRITTPDEAENLIASKDCDGVMIGRSLLADAEWPAKAESGNQDAIRLCISCNTCWEQTGEGHQISCDVNPRVGLADELAWTPAAIPSRKHVAVVGGGVAGLEAAWVAAERGCEVTLFGASQYLGGNARLNASIPGCEQLERIYDYQTRRASKAGVSFVLGDAATAYAIADTRPDHVFLATGAAMQEPEGWRVDEPVTDARAMVRSLLADPSSRTAGTAVLYDCDHTPGTYDVADMLADRFDKLVIVTPRESLAQDIATVIRQRIYRRLSEKHVDIVTLNEVETFTGGKVTVRNVYNTAELVIPDVAALTYSNWRKPADGLLKPLNAAGLEVTQIGDCRVPRTLLQTIAEAHHAACEI